MYPFFSFEQRLEEPSKHVDITVQKSWTQREVQQGRYHGASLLQTTQPG